MGDELAFFVASHVPGSATGQRSKIPLLMALAAIVSAIVVFKVLFPG